MKVRQREAASVPWEQLKIGEPFRAKVPGGVVWLKTKVNSGFCTAVDLETGCEWQGGLPPTYVFPVHGEFVEQ